MERKEIEDSAKQPEFIEELDKLSDIHELRNKYNADAKNSEKITENLLVTQYFKRRTKFLPLYSSVAVLIEMEYYNTKNEVLGKIVPGQVGEICGKSDDKNVYGVVFVERPDVNSNDDESLTCIDHDSFACIDFDRNDLLLLVDDYSELDKEIKSVRKSDYNSEENNTEKNLQSQFPSTSEIEKFIVKTAKNISKILPAYYEKNLKPGKLVTISIDFFEDKNDSYEIKIFAGEVGLILDPTDNIINKNINSQINKNKELQEDEVLVYFPKLSMWHIFDAFITGYKNLQPFDGDQCYILSKSYLLPLFFTNQSDIK